MNVEHQVERARLLIDHDHCARAEEELCQVLAKEPDHAKAHALMALCLSKNKNRLRDAIKYAERSVHLGPDQSFGHWALAYVLYLRNKLPAALHAADQAVSLNPYFVQAHSLRGDIFLVMNRFQECLEAAETGLSLDPDDDRCRYLRSSALANLGRSTDALVEAQRSLSINPDSPTAHAAMGWALLNSGQYRAAQDAFLEYLRLAPTDDFSRTSMIYALKNEHVVYRHLFKLYSWIWRMSERMIVGLIISFIIGIALCYFIAWYLDLPSWAKLIIYMTPTYGILAWTADSLFETYLRFHPQGQYLISRKAMWESNVLSLIALCSVFVGIYLGISTNSVFRGGLVFVSAMMLAFPAELCFRVKDGWPQLVAIGAAITLFLLFIAGFAGEFLRLFPDGIALKLIYTYLISSLVFTVAGFELLVDDVRQ